jgi:hypothetical protein
VTFNDVKNYIKPNDIEKILLEFNCHKHEDLSTDDYDIYDSILYHREDAELHRPKMYYYKETKIFHDYKLGISFDIFALITDLKDDKDWNDGHSLSFIKRFLNMKDDYQNNLYDWKKDLGGFKKAETENSLELPIYSEKILDRFDKGHYHLSWLQDNISIPAMDKFGIRYNKCMNKIIIPNRDIAGNFIGLRYRTTDKSKDYKYKPYTDLKGTLYTFPSGLTFYGIYENKKNIRDSKKVILFEAEKSVLQIETYNLSTGNIALGMLGSTLTKEKIELLKQLDVKEVYIALDFDYHKILDSEWLKYRNKVMTMARMLNPYFNIKLITTKDEHPYKCSPSDLGKEKFLELYKNAIDIKTQMC